MDMECKIGFSVTFKAVQTSSVVIRIYNWIYIRIIAVHQELVILKKKKKKGKKEYKPTVFCEFSWQECNTQLNMYKEKCYYKCEDSCNSFLVSFVLVNYREKSGYLVISEVASDFI